MKLEDIKFKDFNKTSLYYNNMELMFNKTNIMFRYNNLPSTVPQYILELNLQLNGNIFWLPVKDDIYVFTGGIGGPLDVYYRPTIYTIANPALDLTVMAEINVDGVLMLNDSLSRGLYPLHKKYCDLLTENEVTLYIALINERLTRLMTADDEATREAAYEYIKDIKDGKLGVIAQNPFFDGLTLNNDKNNSNLISIIETEQYLKASWLNEIGLNANYNMKRERLITTEAELYVSSLFPLIDDMLYQRQEAVKKINSMFNLNIEVYLNPKWSNNLKGGE